MNPAVTDFQYLAQHCELPVAEIAVRAQMGVDRVRVELTKDPAP